MMDAKVTIPTTISPKTASLFLNRRRQASRHNDVPRTNSPPSTGRTSASATAISGGVWINSSCSGLSSIAISFVLRALLIPYSRIEKRVSDINQQIHQQERYRNKCHDAD